MKKAFITSLFALFLVSLASTSAIAQDHSRNWDNGNVVSVTEVHIKDGMFNAYINDLNNVWRKYNDAQMKDGTVVSYHVYSNTAPREGEPDLYLTVTYTNWAAFDLGEEYFNSIRDKVLGSESEARSAGMKRGDLRVIGSEYNLQEIKFRD
ncbi:MAG: hypothetical protein MUP31_06430 [Xanthomonadales bacterium]|nr:hypothetical protein [Xanthomonadales bacterium]